MVENITIYGNFVFKLTKRKKTIDIPVSNFVYCGAKYGLSSEVDLLLSGRNIDKYVEWMHSHNGIISITDSMCDCVIFDIDNKCVAAIQRAVVSSDKHYIRMVASNALLRGRKSGFKNSCQSADLFENQFLENAHEIENYRMTAGTINTSRRAVQNSSFIWKIQDEREMQQMAAQIASTGQDALCKTLASISSDFQ